MLLEHGPTESKYSEEPTEQIDTITGPHYSQEQDPTRILSKPSEECSKHVFIDEDGRTLK